MGITYSYLKCINLVIISFAIKILEIVPPLRSHMQQTLSSDSSACCTSICRERLDEIGKIKREPDTAALAVASASASTVPADNHIPRRLGHGGALNTLTPCAACKLLRRRCAQECPFAPYFSPHEPHKFAAVHKVFGASNVSKMLLVKPQLEEKIVLF